MESMLVNSSQTVSLYGDLSLQQDFLYKYFGGEKGDGGSYAGGIGGLTDAVSVWSLLSTLPLDGSELNT